MRWKNLRDSFAKAEKDMKAGKKSGSKATKKRKYIFYNELQFLKKEYIGREVIDSQDNQECVIEEANSNKDKDKIDPPAAIEKRGLINTRKHKKMDEVDLKIIRALETPKEKPNSSMLFFESLLPMIENFNRDEKIQLQIGVLNVISTIVNKQTQVSPNQGHPPPVAQQPAPYYQQSYNVPGTSQYHYFPPPHPTSFYQPHTASSITKPSTNQTNMCPIPPQTQVKNVFHTSTSMPAERIQETPVLPLSRVGIDKTEKMANVRQFVENFSAVEDNTESSSSAHTETSSLDMDLYHF